MVGPEQKRVYILTRSAFAGQQRYAAGCWSGDINATRHLRQADPGRASAYAHLRDAVLDHRHRRLLRAHPDWTSSANNELFTRWFQFGAFSHVPHPRTGARSSTAPVERRGQGQHARSSSTICAIA